MKQSNHLSRREKQYEDSARFVGYTLVLAITGIIGLIVYNVIVHGI